MFRTVLVSGGSSGIGLDLAKAYAAKGCNIILLARNTEKLSSAKDQCRQLALNEQQKILTFSVDVANKVQLQSCVDAIQQEGIMPDLLILSAGILQSIRFLDQSDEDFERILNTNVLGSRAVAKAFLPEMVSQKSGHVCFVGSLASTVSTYGYSAYSASKFAVLGMAGALRQELHGHGIAVSVLCPPEVDTPMVAAERDHVLPETRFIKDIGGTIPVSTVTRAAMKGIRRKQYMIVPGIMGKLTYIQARLMPRTLNWLLQQMVKLAPRFGKR
ncbi:SDR family oxidoreductase [uncultured Endozoicomonas sp.]|uniref:SDR family oxidoreductase n=1 Tax=uncultured Endozoicomonas sp. TaxID=432652 RepID=UPI0026022958|nr:SDR family oxidoreductase [uncultured Endozoicomonas sp.]